MCGTDSETKLAIVRVVKEQGSSALWPADSVAPSGRPSRMRRAMDIIINHSASQLDYVSCFQHVSTAVACRSPSSTTLCQQMRAGAVLPRQASGEWYKGRTQWSPFVVHTVQHVRSTRSWRRRQGVARVAARGLVAAGRPPARVGGRPSLSDGQKSGCACAIDELDANGHGHAESPNGHCCQTTRPAGTQLSVCHQDRGRRPYPWKGARRRRRDPIDRFACLTSLQSMLNQRGHIQPRSCAEVLKMKMKRIHFARSWNAQNHPAPTPRADS